MPLPAEGSVFPPKEYAPGFARMAEHAAWYSGSVDDLRRIYGGLQAATHVHNGRPHRGGVAGFFSRAWWGRPLVSGEERTALHIPIAANLATLSSDLLNAEPATFGIVGDVDKTSRNATEERLDLIFNSPHAHVVQNEAGETTAALGGTYWVADWDVAGPFDYVHPRAVDADVAVPTFRGGELSEVTFWTRIDDGRKVYRHLEHHEVGAITHALYLSDDSDRLGVRVPLATLPETRHLADLAGAIHEPDRTIIPTYIDRLTAVYEPNIRRSRRLRKGPLRAWGRSDYEGIEPMLNSFDETWSSWMRDLKVGRARIFVPEALLSSGGPGQGGFFDAEREVYALLNALPSKDGKQIEAHQFEIRVEQHERTAYNLKKEILQATGYSLSSYGEHAEGQAMTATEVTDRRSDTERTRDKKIRYATHARTQIASVCLELDGLIFRGRGGRPGVEVVAEFPEVSQVDPEKEIRIVSLLDAASAITTETKVRRANPEWDDERVMKEVAGIQAERGLTAPDPATFTS
jgi:A118 family predicted phage portal protein